LVSSVYANLNSSSESLNDIISNSTITSDILLNLENHSGLINNIAQLAEIGTAFANQSEGFRNRARPRAVDILQQHLLNIDGMDSAKLVSVQTFISRLEQEITMQNVLRYLEVDFKNSGAQDNSYKRNYQVCKSKLSA